MAFLLSITFLLFIAHWSHFVLAAPWVVTKYVEETTVIAGPAESQTTDVVWVSLTVDNPSAVSTATSIESYYSDITYIDVVVEPGQGQPYTRDFNNEPIYYVRLTRTWPESCSPSTGVFTTESMVDVPYQIKWAFPQPPPATTTATTLMTTTLDSYDRPTLNKVYLDPTDIPEVVMDSILLSPPEFRLCEFGSDYEYEDCRREIYKIGGLYIGESECCEDGCHIKRGVAPWGLVVAIVVTWFSLVLLIGLVRSQIGFKKMMVGERAPRGIPGAFVCLLPFLSCILCFALKDGYQARAPEERIELQKKWIAMPFWKKTVLWFRWGFSSKYPPMLGTPPPRIREGKSGQTQCSPPRTTGTATRRTTDVELQPPPPSYSSVVQGTGVGSADDEAQVRR